MVTDCNGAISDDARESLPQLTPCFVSRMQKRKEIENDTDTERTFSEEERDFEETIQTGN